MSQIAVPFGVQFNREKAEAVGLASSNAATTVTERGLSGVAPADGSPGLVVELDLFLAVVLQVTVRVVDATGTLVELRSTFGDDTWITTNDVGAVLVLDNGGEQTIDLCTRFSSGGQRVPTPRLRFAGTTLTTLTSGVLTVDVTYETHEWAITDRVSNARAVAFADTGTGDAPPNVPNLVARLEGLFGFTSGGRVVLGTTGSGREIIVNDCAVALPHPSFVVWIDPADVGNQPEQLPPDVQSNTGNRYLFHPGAFYRTTPYVRTVKTERIIPCRQIESGGNGSPTVEAAPITTVDGAAFALQVVRAPTHSRWGLIVDGAWTTVIVKHPDGSNLRRPRDVYNAVWSRDLQLNAVGDGIPIWRDIVDGSSRTFAQVGTIGRLAFVEYLQFLEPLDGDAENDIVTPFFQNGGELPPPPS